MKSTDQYFFFLQLTEQLPDYFYMMAEVMLDHDAQLLPISLEELSNIQTRHRKNVIAIIPSCSVFAPYLMARKKFLDRGIKTGIINLFEISSFSPASLISNRSYKHFPLPADLKNVSQKILTHANPTYPWKSRTSFVNL